MNEEMNTVSEEQILHNKLSFEINQELIHLMKRIVELQQENARLKEKIEKGIDKLEYYNSGEALWYVPIQDIIDILKET